MKKILYRISLPGFIVASILLTIIGLSFQEYQSSSFKERRTQFLTMETLPKYILHYVTILKKTDGKAWYSIGSDTSIGTIAYNATPEDKYETDFIFEDVEGKLFTIYSSYFDTQRNKIVFTYAIGRGNVPNVSMRAHTLKEYYLDVDQSLRNKLMFDKSKYVNLIDKWKNFRTDEESLYITFMLISLTLVILFGLTTLLTKQSLLKTFWAFLRKTA